MQVLGIDPGTAITGYGLVVESPQGTLHANAYGAITTTPGMNTPDRLQKLYWELDQIILLHRPDCCAVEKLFFQRNITTAINVGQARGVVLLACANHSLPVAEYTPLEIKQAATGYGSAGKKQMQGMIQALLCLDRLPSPDDAADALAVAICHINSQRIKSLGQP